MGAFQILEDGELDQLLAGVPPDDESLAGLAAFVVDVRAVSEEPVPESLAGRQVAQAARAVEVSVEARQPARQRPGEVLRPRNRRKVVLRSSLARLAAKVAAASVALAAMTAGAAAAGVLPAPVQQVVADTAAVVGLELPEPSQSQSLPEEAVLGQEEAERKHLAAEAYAEAVQDWTDCVAENAAAQGDEETRQPDPFDPTEGCGREAGSGGLRDHGAAGGDAPGSARGSAAGSSRGSGRWPAGRNPSGPAGRKPSGPAGRNPSGPAGRDAPGSPILRQSDPVRDRPPNWGTVPVRFRAEPPSRPPRLRGFPREESSLRYPAQRKGVLVP
jgi:hypothetical protein